MDKYESKANVYHLPVSKIIRDKSLRVGFVTMGPVIAGNNRKSCLNKDTKLWLA